MTVSPVGVLGRDPCMATLALLMLANGASMSVRSERPERAGARPSYSPSGGVERRSVGGI